mmetsp:Transcript_23275/g.32481  ORF Transcript_23275/g.32481 Transcript_23275/m.32481 type:complete len:238 (+) Transcript_23275:2-715(+)
MDSCLVVYIGDKGHGICDLNYEFRFFECSTILACPGVGFQDVFQGRLRDDLILMAFHGILDQPRDVEEPDLVVSKHSNGLFICSIESRSHRSTSSARSIGKFHAGILFLIWRLERQSALLHQIEAVVWHGLPVRPSDGVEERQTHVRPSELCENGCILGLNHGVDDGLGMDYDVDVIVIGSEEVVSLNHLKSLVHQSGRVYGNFGSHIPIWMFERIFQLHLVQVLCIPVSKSTSRSR